MKYGKNKRVLIWAPIIVGLSLIPAAAFGAPPAKNVTPPPVAPGTLLGANGKPIVAPVLPAAPKNAGCGLAFADPAKCNPQAAAPAPSTNNPGAPAPANGAPAPASGSIGTAPGRAPTDSPDLSKEDLNGGLYVKNFEADTDQSGKSVTLFGNIFSACQQYLSISNTMSNQKINNAGMVGFELTDNGFKACEDKIGTNNPCGPTGTQTACVSLSRLPNAKMSLASMNHSGQVNIVMFDPNGDRHPYTAEALGLPFKTAADMQADQINGLEKQMKTCTKVDDMPLREDAIAQLLQMGVMTQAQADAELLKDGQTQLDALTKRVGKDKIGTLSASLVPDIQAFAAANPNLADKSADVLVQVAERFENDSSDTKSQKNYDNAKAALQAAKDLDGISDSEDSKLTKALKDNEIGDVGFLAQNGDISQLMKMNKSLSSELCGGNVSLYALGVTISQPQYASQAAQIVYSSCSKVRNACRNSAEGMTNCADTEKDAADVARLFAAAQQVNVQSQYQNAAMMNGSLFGGQNSAFGGAGNPLSNPFAQPGISGMPSTPMYGGAMPNGFPGTVPQQFGTPNYMAPGGMSPQFGAPQSTSFQGPMWAGGSYSNPFSRGF